jgi:hypothetical protein
MKRISCELCQSNDFTKDADGLFVCDYCRAKYTPEQAQALMGEGTVRVDKSEELTNLVALAGQAIRGGNHQEVYSYASRALEVDPRNSEAWRLKGVAAGWLSTIFDVRTSEMVSSFESAIEHAADEARYALRTTCAEDTLAVVNACYLISYKSAQESAILPSSWEQHIIATESIIGALQKSYEWKPSDAPLRKIVQVASELIAGVPFEHFNGTEMEPMFRILTPEATLAKQQLIAAVSLEITKYDPNFAAPKTNSPAGAAESKCFVVTATMGSETSLPVITLRNFRDTFLMPSVAGRQFVSWYYEVGPIVAERIQRSVALRAVSFGLIVFPSTVLAWLTLRLTGKHHA